jgi:hypothetical protein
MCSIEGCGELMPQKFDSSKELWKHKRSVHSTGSWTCSLCNTPKNEPMQFGSMTDLRAHNSKMHGDRAYICNTVGCFLQALNYPMTQRQLECHQEQCHDHRDRYCPTCEGQGKILRPMTLRGFAAHLRTHGKSIQCNSPRCGYKTWDSSYLVEHKWRVHGETTLISAPRAFHVFDHIGDSAFRREIGVTDDSCSLGEGEEADKEWSEHNLDTGYPWTISILPPISKLLPLIEQDNLSIDANDDGLSCPQLSLTSSLLLLERYVYPTYWALPPLKEIPEYLRAVNLGLEYWDSR